MTVATREMSTKDNNNHVNEMSTATSISNESSAVGSIIVENTEPKRVKVYVLENNEWKDTGTGFCIGTVNTEVKSQGVKSEETENSTSYAYMTVNNEDIPGSLLLKSKLEGNTEYQRQEETLIVWKDATGCDIALSFEESMGCDALCEFIIQVQKQIESNISLVTVKTSLNGMGSVHEMIAGPVPLPSNDKDQNEALLLESLKILTENTAFEFLKNQTIEYILQSDYIDTLICHFHKAEKEQQLEELLLLSNIIKTLILYNQRDILEQLVEDRFIMGIVGILEYDTEFPTSKANHRKYLDTSGPHFKEVIPWENEDLKGIIKKCFRLHFLKDVVLVRFLEDHNLDLILDVILDLETCIIDFLQVEVFIDKLVELYSKKAIADDISESAMEKRKDGIRLLHQCVQMSRNLDDMDKSKFYRVLVKKGLFKIMEYAFNIETDNSVRILSTDTIITIIEHDILLIHSVQAKKHQSNVSDNLRVDETYNSSDMSLLLILSTIMLTDKSPGLKEQVIQALYTLLHPDDCLGESNGIFDDVLNDRNNGDLLDDLGYDVETKNDISEGNNNSLEKTETCTEFKIMEYFGSFYGQVAPTLFKPLIFSEYQGKYQNGEEDLLLIHLVKLLSFICTEHDRRISREFVLENAILDSISDLIKPHHMLQLRLTAVRCFKNIICLNDTFYYRYMISKELFAPVIGLMEECLDKDNLANSCIQDFFNIVASQCSSARGVSDLEDELLHKTTPSYKRTNFILLNNHLFQKYELSLLQARSKIDFISTMLEIRNHQLEADIEEPTTELDLSDNDITMNTSEDHDTIKNGKQLHSEMDNLDNNHSGNSYGSVKLPTEITANKPATINPET